MNVVMEGRKKQKKSYGGYIKPFRLSFTTRFFILRVLLQRARWNRLNRGRGREKGRGRAKRSDNWLCASVHSGIYNSSR
ncbi:hypothetical protein SUGI_0731960 [Cryptomeria japonica]|nr:hypothetical protein SUGI_0731960 [Cryptomeria japonica]